MSDCIYIQDKRQAITFIAGIFETSRHGEYLHSYTKFPDSWLLNVMDKIGYPFSVIIEEHHIDRIYRDSYYIYFSNQHFEKSRFCKRLSFFKMEIKDSMFWTPSEHEKLKKAYIGSCVIRPLENGAIGRTLLKPEIFVPDGHDLVYERLTKFTLHIKGVDFTVESFPYSMQDTETTSCSEITLLNIIEYFATHYPDYRLIAPSDIVKISGDSSFERVIPTKGMKYTQLTKTLTTFGFSPRLYYKTGLLFGQYSLEKIWHYYIESGIPVAMGLGKQSQKAGHSIIGIGHSNRQRDFDSASRGNKNGVNYIDTADLYYEYAIMDDNQLPFSVKDISDLTNYQFEPSTLAVPLSKRMFMEATDAFDISTLIITNDAIGIKKVSGKFEDYQNLGSYKDPFVLRLFLTSASSFKKNKIMSDPGDVIIKKIYANLPLPRFVWVCEIYSKQTYAEEKTIGEIVLDATSSSKSELNSLVSLQYLNRIGIRTPEQKVEDLIEWFSTKELPRWNPLPGFRGNLTQIKKRC